MRRSLVEGPIVKLASVLFLGLLLVTASSCKKKLPPAPPPAPEAAPLPAPEMPTTPVEEAPIPPAKEPTEKVEDIDDTIKRQNTNRDLLRTVYFDFDKADLREDQVSVLKANAAWLKSHPQYKVLVEGHCDERDTIEYNLALGDRRAKAVRQYLNDLGVGADRIRTISYGEERPAVPGHDEEAWSRNRRAEFTLEK